MKYIKHIYVGSSLEIIAGIIDMVSCLLIIFSKYQSRGSSSFKSVKTLT